MNNSFEFEYRGLPIRRFNVVVSLVSLLISVLLLIATGRTGTGYEEMRAATENYIILKQCADDIATASDYLSDQTRYFTSTGDLKYIENYFKEVHETRRREESLHEMTERLGDSVASRWAATAVSHSIALQEQEYYAMRLVATAYEYDLASLPEEVASVELLPEDAALPPVLKHDKASGVIAEQGYVEEKSLIAESVRLCLIALVNETRTSQETSLSELHQLLQSQRVFVVALITTVLAVVTATSLLLISPLVRGVLHIQNEQPIPIRGAAEFRFLAKTYNMMFAANRERTEHLAYEATHDRLTGLYNRSGYDFLMKNAELETSALLLIDVDKFKDVNDTYGHGTGDRALVRVASVLRESFRDEDYICRIGGDEFAAIMVNTGPQFAELIHEKVTRINDKLLHPDDGLPPLSLSVGVAFGANAPGGTRLAKNADLALYQVKEDGRCGCAFHRA